MSVQLHTLANGFRIVTEAMPGLQSATIGLWVAVGGRNERPEQNGIAHFLEHMAFKGTDKRTTLEIAEVIEDVGGYINAYTSREMTAYYARVLAADVPLALDVLADILRAPRFDEAEIELERGVILQEIGQVLDTPDDVIFDWLQEVAFPGQALGRSILGPAERVSGFGRADLSDFVGAHYGPGQLILSAAGAIDHDALVTLAETLFGDMAPAPLAAATPARFATGERREARALEQAHLAMAFESPGYRDPAHFTAQIYATALGGGMSSRLFQEIREKRGLCYSVFAQSGAWADTGLITLYAGTGGGQVHDLATLMADELARAGRDMRAEEVARAKAQLRAGLLMGLESPSARAERMARLVSIWGRVPDVAESLAQIEAVGLDDVRTFARTLAQGAAPALALYGPIAEAPDMAALQARLAA